MNRPTLLPGLPRVWRGPTELQLGSGITTVELGARLRYEFFPRSGPAVIAPYVGVSYEWAFGETQDFRVAAGEDADGVKLVFGLRTWF